MDTLRLGLIGTRASGAQRLAALRSRSDVELIATSGPGPQRGVMHFEDAAGLLRREDLDAVIYAGTAGESAQTICTALERGLHVLSLRPPGMGVEDVIAVRTAESHAQGKVVQFSYPLHFHGSVSTAKALVRGDGMGQLVNMRGVYSTVREPGQAGRGGAMFDKGMQMVDLMQSFAGPFSEVKSFIDQRVWGEPGFDDNAHALLRTHNGITASIHASATWWRETFRLELGFTGGYIWLDGLTGDGGTLGPEMLIVGKCRTGPDGRTIANPEEEITEFKSNNAVDLELADFLHTVRGRGAPEIGTSTHAFDAINTVARIYADDEAWMPRDSGLNTVAAAQ